MVNAIFILDFSKGEDAKNFNRSICSLKALMR